MSVSPLSFWSQRTYIFVMKPDEVHSIIGDVRSMSVSQAWIFHDLMTSIGCQHALELGFYQGTGSCYMAGILEEIGDGHLVGIDIDRPTEFMPHIKAEDQLERCGLRERATLYWEPCCYTTKLLNFLEESPRPEFDFIYLDGAHTWSPDGFAFFLADKLLMPGGYLVLDDLRFSWGGTKRLSAQALKFWASRIPSDSWADRQVYKIWELLVKEHPGYTDFQEVECDGIDFKGGAMMGVCRKI